MIDLHCHVLPGVDDGPETWEEALALGARLADEGVTLAVATPHFFWARSPNPDPMVIRAHLARLNQALQGRLRLLPGAEVRIVPEVRDWAGRLAQSSANGDRALLLAGTSSVLLELPPEIIPPGVERLFFELLTVGVRPVLAHGAPQMLQGARRIEDRGIVEIAHAQISAPGGGEQGYPSKCRLHVLGAQTAGAHKHRVRMGIPPEEEQPAERCAKTHAQPHPPPANAERDLSNPCSRHARTHMSSHTSAIFRSRKAPSPQDLREIPALYDRLRILDEERTSDSLTICADDVLPRAPQLGWTRAQTMRIGSDDMDQFGLDPPERCSSRLLSMIPQ